MSEVYKLHRNLLVCPGERSCGECIQVFPELAEGDKLVASLSSERDPAVDRMIEDCPNNCLLLVVP